MDSTWILEHVLQKKTKKIACDMKWLDDVLKNIKISVMHQEWIAPIKNIRVLIHYYQNTFPIIANINVTKRKCKTLI